MLALFVAFAVCFSHSWLTHNCHGDEKLNPSGLTVNNFFASDGDAFLIERTFSIAFHACESCRRTRQRMRESFDVLAAFRFRRAHQQGIAELRILGTQRYAGENFFVRQACDERTRRAR
jgi:hypothetical protein